MHPGGPYWENKNEGAWTVPKGVVAANEDPFAAARREFKEETRFDVDGQFRDLGMFLQPGGKRLHVWALEGDCDPLRLVSDTFDLVWPPKSGRIQQFPEIDRGAWFKSDVALVQILQGQRPFLQKVFAETTPPA